MHSPPSSLLFVAASALALACHREKAAEPSLAAPFAAATGPAVQAPDPVLATWDGNKVTMAQVDQKLGSKLFEMRRQALDQLVLEQLVKAEATKRNLSEDELLKAEIDDKVARPSEEQIQQTFKQAQGQLPPGSTIDAYRERIVDSLAGPKRQERARVWFEELKQRSKVVMLLQEPRKEIEAKGPARGPEDAKVTIIEFSDFQCPFCSRAHDTVEEVMRAYAGKVRLVFRQYPLDFHENAAQAAEAALCANEQGKFWEYHDVLFKNQSKLAISDLKGHAEALGIDAKKFGDCLDSKKNAAVVQADMVAGKKVGVSGTPAFFINGIMLSGAQPIEEFRRVIDQELARN